MEKTSLTKSLLFIHALALVIFVSGCALVKPTRHFEESTPIDQGMAGRYLSTAVVMPFEARGSDDWGVYAAQRFTGYLIGQKAFRKVTCSSNIQPGTDCIITGSLDHLFYGGNDTPTTVFLTIKVLSADASQTLFHRTVKASSRMSAFHMTWLRSMDVPSPYVEEVLNNLLERIAKDIASRTNLPAIQSP